MFSVKKDLSVKLDRAHSRYTYWNSYPVLYLNKLGLFDFFSMAIVVQNISKSGLLAKIKTKRKFTVDERLMLEFDNYFTEAIPVKVVRWEPEVGLIAVQFNREIKLIERIALNIA